MEKSSDIQYWKLWDKIGQLNSLQIKDELIPYDEYNTLTIKYISKFNITHNYKNEKDFFLLKWIWVDVSNPEKYIAGHTSKEYAEINITVYKNKAYITSYNTNKPDVSVTLPLNTLLYGKTVDLKSQFIEIEFTLTEIKE